MVRSRIQMVDGSHVTFFVTWVLLRDRLVYMDLKPVRKELVAKSKDWRWSSYNNFTLDKKIVAGCPIQIDDVRLPESCRA